MKPPLERQTVWTVSIQILLSIAMFLATPVLFFGDAMDPSRTVERIISGTFFAIIFIALGYARLPVERRLPPAHTIGLGGLYLVLIAWMGLTTPPRANPNAVGVLGMILMPLPGCYLLVMGVRAVIGGTGRRYG